MFSKLALGLYSNPGQERFIFYSCIFFSNSLYKMSNISQVTFGYLALQQRYRQNQFLPDIQRSKENIKRLNAIQFYMRTLKMKRKNYKKRYSLAEFKPKPRANFEDNFRVQFLKDLLSVYYLLNLTFKMGQKLRRNQNWLEW